MGVCVCIGVYAQEGVGYTRGCMCVWRCMRRSVCREQVSTMGIDPQVPFTWMF